MKMESVIYEYDAIIADDGHLPDDANGVPVRVFTWLESQCLSGESADTRWLRITKQHGRRALQVTGYVGVIRAPCGYQIEVLPKIGKATDAETARGLLIQMLACLGEFRHILTDDAHLLSKRMPLFDVFIRHFICTVEALVRRGVRGGYVAQQNQLAFLRGKLLVSVQIRSNAVRRDRFMAEFDDFVQDRPENRLVRAALRRTLSLCRSEDLRRRARELCFVFHDIPESLDVARDLRMVRIERDMSRYEQPLAWARLILQGMSPLTGSGEHLAPSLLFPMEALFEAYVAKHLGKQLADGYHLKAQARSQYLTLHLDRPWFQMKPDLLIQDATGNRQVLDTKWKLIDAQLANRQTKYQLSQSDFYQLYAYGHHYLKGDGDVVLIYPKTDDFMMPLAPFHFPQQPGMRLWVLPFCLRTKTLLLPDDEQVGAPFLVPNPNAPFHDLPICKRRPNIRPLNRTPCLAVAEQYQASAVL